MPDYVRLAATAKRLIEANGRNVTLYKPNTTPANPSQPWRGPDTTSPPDSGKGGDSLTVLACFVPARGTSFGADRTARPGSLLEDVEQYALIASTSMPDGTDLTQYDSIDDGSNIWQIVFSGELRPSTTSLIWEVGVKR